MLLTVGTPGVAGYSAYGSLFRGSGSWVVKAATLPNGGLSDHGAEAMGDTVYIVGGTSQGNASTPMLGAFAAQRAVLERDATFDF